MGPGMFNGLGRAIGCLLLIVALGCFAAGFICSRCSPPYSVRIERAR